MRGKRAIELRRLARLLTRGQAERGYVPVVQHAGSRHHINSGGWGFPVQPVSGRTETGGLAVEVIRWSEYTGRNGRKYIRIRHREPTTRPILLTIGKACHLDPNTTRSFYKKLKQNYKSGRKMGAFNLGEVLRRIRPNEGTA